MADDPENDVKTTPGGGHDKYLAIFMTPLLRGNSEARQTSRTPQVVLELI
jgi:hypothetical protein